MVGRHHRLDGHEFEQAPGVGDGQGGLACCSPWGRKESDATEQLNCTDIETTAQSCRPRCHAQDGRNGCMCRAHCSLRRLHPRHAPRWGTCGCSHTRPKLGPGLRQAPHDPPLLPPTSQALGGTQKSEPVISGNRNPSEKPRVTDNAHPRFPASVRDIPVGPRHQGGTGPSAESTVDRPPRNDGCGWLQTRPTLIPAQPSGCG